MSATNDSKASAGERRRRRARLTDGRGQAVRMPASVAGSLVDRIVREFCERFAPGARLVYAGGGWEYFDGEALELLGVTPSPRDLLPDVVVHDAGRGRLILIEAVTCGRPTGEVRRIELETLFWGCAADRAFVSVFPDRAALATSVDDIPWGTGVWLARPRTI